MLFHAHMKKSMQVIGKNNVQFVHTFYPNVGRGTHIVSSIFRKNISKEPFCKI